MRAKLAKIHQSNPQKQPKNHPLKSMLHPCYFLFYYISDIQCFTTQNVTPKNLQNPTANSNFASTDYNQKTL